MTILSWAEFIATRELAPLSVTIGVFDGVHLGHRRLLDTVLSKSPSMKSSVITFKDNPKKVLHPQSFKGSIFSMEQKLDVFRTAGIDACVLIDFSQNFGTLSGAEFLSLLANAGVKFLCVGPNFRCGHRMDTNAQALAEISRRLGMEAEIAEPVLYGSHPVSSSRIRNAIVEGRLSEAADMLGRPHKVELEAVTDRQADASGGMALRPTADALLPPEGNYRVVVETATGKESLVARIGEGLIRVESMKGRGAGRVAIMNVVSQEWKEI